jgi:putative ABC transport system permease protein
MFRYYVWLALRSLRRNPVLTALMVAAIGLGIGASMTTLSLFRAMSGDPIPWKSSRLFTPIIDNWGPDQREKTGEPGQDMLSYTDAMALLNTHAAQRQAAMYATGFAVLPPDPKQNPFQADARATGADFFSMFEVPFKYGTPWGAADDEARADVVVLGKKLNDKLFGGANSVGKTVNLDNRDYRVVGVLDEWSPQPRFYDVMDQTFGDVEMLFLPFSTAIGRQMDVWGNNNCAGPSAVPPGWDGHLHSECTWVQFWAELDTAEQAQHYRSMLDGYAAEQQRTGRFHWAPLTRLYDVKKWFDVQHVVPDESRILVVVSFGFLFVCLVNAVGLMLAKFMTRASEIGVRRAIGANRRAVFTQCLVETGVIGLAGGVLGLVLTAFGLIGMRSLLSKDMAALTHLDLIDMVVTVALAVLAAMLAGLYPTWRATQVQPAWQLKAN